MDKIHNIGLGGFSFTIEEIAFNKLKNYLAEIRSQLKDNESREEIITDIEYRMAELIKERLKYREIINMGDVDYLIDVLGTPDAYCDEEDGESKENTQTHTTQEKVSKKLFRDPDHRILGGVLSGLAYYFGIERTWLRLGFLLSLFVFLVTCPLIYFILWIIVPLARTTSERLQMVGTPVNVDSIKEFSKTNKNEPKGNSFLRNFCKIILKIIVGLFIFIIAIIPISLIVSLVAIMLGANISMGELGLKSLVYIPLIFNHSWEIWLLYICISLVCILPLIALVLFLITTLSKRFKAPKKVYYIILLTFIGALFTFIAMGINLSKNFTYPSDITLRKDIKIPSDTLVIEAVKEFKGKKIKDLIEFKNNQYLYKIDDNINVKSTNDSIPYFEIEMKARGANTEDAENNVNTIHYVPRIKGNTIYLDRFLIFDKGTKWRDQRVNITLFLPKNKFVMMKSGFDIRPEKFRRIRSNSKNIYGFVDNKFKCINCPKENNNDVLSDEDIEDIENAMENINGNVNIKIDSASGKKKIDIEAGPVKINIQK